MDAKVLTADGSVSTTDVDLAQLGDKARHRLLHVAVLRYAANTRQGTHSTKTRSNVAKTGRKPFRQKGTGRARAGDFKSPIWRGGGIIHGPHPRGYRKAMTKRARNEALRSALFTKFQDEQASFVEGVAWDKPSTKSAKQMLEQLAVQDGGATVVLGEKNEMLRLSCRNLPAVDVVPASDLNAMDLLRRRHVIFVGDALDRVRSRLAEPAKTGEES